MQIRQVENTPIGDFFHDNNMIKTFERIKDTVDEFDVDTEELVILIDYLGSKLKEMKNLIKKIEQKESKKSFLEDLQKGVDL